jgi:hypothetical protein
MQILSDLPPVARPNLQGLESEVSFSAGFLSSLSARSLDAGSSQNGSPSAQIVIVVAQRLNHKGGFIVRDRGHDGILS